ncbi:hypothetical protein [Streptomyces sp. NPDC048508]|uniref:hypothetical protein n=1 Tax=Streptomyces sp. NPDC048508 TaxID=3365561 RepID=UPI00371205B3
MFSESAAVDSLTRKEASERMAQVFAIRPLDALDGNRLNVRNHDGKQLMRR